jgi:hypothetical protein
MLSCDPRDYRPVLPPRCAPSSTGEDWTVSDWSGEGIEVTRNKTHPWRRRHRNVEWRVENLNGVVPLPLVA